MRETFASAPIFNGIEKGIDHFRVVDKVDKTEAHIVFVPFFVNHLVNDTRNATNWLSVAVSHKVDAFAEIRSRIFLGVESA